MEENGEKRLRTCGVEEQSRQGVARGTVETGASGDDGIEAKGFC